MTEPVIPPDDDKDCHCGQASGIADERLKAVTDRLDVLNANMLWMCQTIYSILTSIPRNGMAGLMMRNVLNKIDQGQAPHGD